MDVTTSAALPTPRPGKSGQSVGHMVKAAVSEAKTSGIDLPKNAQGMAASAIAKGADPASVFAALLVQPEVPAGEAPAMDAPDGGTVADVPEEDTVVDAPKDPAPETEAAAGYGDAAEIVGDAALTGAGAALALLDGTI